MHDDPNMKAKGGDWSFADLNAFLTKPAAFVSGTKITYPGEPDAQKRADIPPLHSSLTPNRRSRSRSELRWAGHRRLAVSGQIESSGGQHAAKAVGASASNNSAARLARHNRQVPAPGGTAPRNPSGDTRAEYAPGGAWRAHDVSPQQQSPRNISPIFEPPRFADRAG